MRAYPPYTSKRKIQLVISNTPYTILARRKQLLLIRIAIALFIIIFIVVQLNVINYDFHPPSNAESSSNSNDTTQAILQSIPQVLHKYLKPRNNSQATNSSQATNNDRYQAINISDIQRSIERYNEYQTIINEDVFGPLQNDSIVIVVQVHKRITYLRHLIVSLAQAKDISKTLLIFSHDFYDEEINDLVQSIDFCKVMQIFYPFSIQTHPNEFPGTDPKDCKRDMKKEQAAIVKCQNADFPDLYGHYREASFTQTKNHWWWKANRVFDQLEVTRYHTGLVLFLEEDHYVAEDFLYLLKMMQLKAYELCSKCNVMSLGTYLKTFNYYTYNNNHKKEKALFGSFYGSSLSSNNALHSKNTQNHNSLSNGANLRANHVETTTTLTWAFQAVPTLYSVYQKVEVTPWISSKHNMGMAFNRSTWHQIKNCAKYFCSYDDYNWDWSLQHTSHQCLKKKLFAMVVRGPRIFHIGECGVHHKKNNCESNQVISKVQQVISVATKAGQLFPKNLMLTVASVVKKQKIRKGNGGWGDKRDHLLCLNMTLGVR
ncbi:alpha-1,6-mannosyl-glycoprotein 2-beta-N-acetylglucosaminyltransferase isoform X1 [Chironomus tepperi]|uniref:alpha-1,6-mannosyl-glycoprotein 2-beta-N-acetylglucosaminyltransferase isoform X1 n=1 Tax=Chironomus tepperi TaxID=113505 RepID=UPI00391F9FE1